MCHSLDQKLAVLNIDPAVLQVDAAGTQALDLGAFQLDARFQRFEHEILVTRLAVCGDGLCRRTFLGRCMKRASFPLLSCHYITFCWIFKSDF